MVPSDIYSSFFYDATPTPYIWVNEYVWNKIKEAVPEGYKIPDLAIINFIVANNG